ncbi:MAG: DUF4373 domain-containing protein [Ignavibacteria bacterium]|nr:DUF4373 domain-containing protein [Ignavibacteria bacterium]
MKDAYYFQHDANARHDPKLLMLAKECGMEGIGRWWCLVEILREQEDYTFDISERHNLKALKHELNCTSDDDLTTFLDELVELCLIRRFEGKIFSHALLNRMGKLDAVRRARAEGGKKGGRPRKDEKPYLNHKVTSAYLLDTDQNQMVHTQNLPAHLSTNLRSKLSTYTEDLSIHKSTEAKKNDADSPPERNAPERNAPEQNAQERNAQKKSSQAAPSYTRELLTEPDTETLYIYPIRFDLAPAGAYFVPSDSEHNERKVFLKLSDGECLSVKERKEYAIKEPSHIIFTHTNYSVQSSTIH